MKTKTLTSFHSNSGSYLFTGLFLKARREKKDHRLKYGFNNSVYSYRGCWFNNLASLFLMVLSRLCMNAWQLAHTDWFCAVGVLNIKKKAESINYGCWLLFRVGCYYSTSFCSHSTSHLLFRYGITFWFYISLFKFVTFFSCSLLLSNTRSLHDSLWLFER